MVAAITDSLSGIIDVTKLQMLAEALNTIFDLFAETKHNDILAELHLVEKLNYVLPFLAQIVM